MMRMICPFCGPRPENEFRCGGQSHIQRPPVDCTDEAWAAYLFVRDNPKGESAERWHHGFGCGRWFNVLRDTVTHDIKAVYSMGRPRLDIR